MKRLQGLIAATLVTVIIALGMVAIGVNAASNSNSVPVSNSPAQAAQASAATTSNVVNISNSAADQAQIKQLQETLKQYQDREKQYQDREKQYQTELAKVSQQMNDATAQAQQLQQILVALQQRGVIRISDDGRISIPRG
jgi:septal ring factor EnvC (AmiA/AmiB activator)